MSDDAVAKIRTDALDLLGRIVSVYESEVSSGEVGCNGSARASETIPQRPCTGLLYGRIQSGKTVAMIALVAAAMDNGFRIVVVLTSDNVKLVSQTTKRFSVLDGPIAIDARTEGWAEDARHISKHLSQSGVVFVCSKNQKRLDTLIKFLKDIGAPNFPALVLDDEADQATLDTNLAKRVRSEEKGISGVDPTAIYKRVVEQMSTALRHHVFIQVTATPYALLLQNVGTKLRPSFSRLLEPGKGYTGGERFFEPEHIEGPEPPLVFVPEDESQTIQEGTKETPEGLRDAIAFFLVAAAAQELSDPSSAKAGQNFLCHTSQLKKQHRCLEELVRGYVDRIDDQLREGHGESVNRLSNAHEKLLRTFPKAPPLERLLERVARRLVNRRVIVINAESDAELGSALNFIVGGNILGRGVTIENLLVTYYLREPKIGQMDTMLQHARMYGYREKLMHLTRVYLPRQLAVRFHEIHCIERRLRRQLEAADMGKPLLIEKADSLIPTRRAVLDPNYIDAFDAEDQVFPKYPHVTLPTKKYQEINAKIQQLVGGSLASAPQLVAVPFDALLELVTLMPYDERQESSSWIPVVLRKLLEKQRERCAGRAYLYTRKTQRTKTVFATGALSGSELAELRTKDGPVLCAFRDEGKAIKEVAAHPFWYPTLVFDRGMPGVIFNSSVDGA